jgi:hypothetical protein
MEKRFNDLGHSLKSKDGTLCHKVQFLSQPDLPDPAVTKTVPPETPNPRIALMDV